MSAQIFLCPSAAFMKVGEDVVDYTNQVETLTGLEAVLTPNGKAIMLKKPEFRNSRAIAREKKRELDKIVRIY